LVKFSLTFYWLLLSYTHHTTPLHVSYYEVYSIKADPGFGIGCLGKLNSAYENDKELMIGFYKFLAK